MNIFSSSYLYSAAVRPDVTRNIATSPSPGPLYAICNQSFMLRRYWLVTFPENPYGPKNFGVTAFSVSHAKSLAIEELRRLEWKQFSDTEINRAEIIEDIDIRQLDQNHVIPNMGVVSRQGVWFPNCNS